MSAPRESDLSLPIGLTVRRSSTSQIWGTAASLLTKNAPCYGCFNKDAEKCQPGSCEVRDQCRIALGSHAILEARNLADVQKAAAEVGSQGQTPPIAPDTVTYKKGRVRTDGVICPVCTDLIPRGDCLVRKDGALIHTTCGGTHASK